MNLEQALQQAEKIASGGYTPEELRDFLSFMDRADPEQVDRILAVYQVAFDNQSGYQLQVSPDFMDRLRALRPADNELVAIPARNRMVWLRWTAAAALILLAAGAYWFIVNKTPQPSTASNSPAPKNDILPGGNKAILTLAGGQQLILDSAQQGSLAVQGNTDVRKTDNGKLVYHSMGSPSNAVIVYNKLTTPRGGQYQLTLPDGTQVWLNAASSITYPTAFTGKERKVTLTGEAYFEVAKNATMPFMVEENDMVIKVLGTRFDVNGYDNEPTHTAVLVDGAVSVVYGKQEVRLQPGTQAQVRQGAAANGRSAGNRLAGDNQAPVLTVSPADIGQALAWKNGFFAFSKADLPTVMRQLARWYDVDVNYEGTISRDVFEFDGKIGKSLSLDQVLQLLTKTHVHYTIQGKQLTIRP